MADGTRTLNIPFGQELVVDLFAGGGGASTGIGLAYREPDVAVNHSPIAIAVHQANHRNTRHFTCDVYEVDPLVATGGLPVGILWASPDCRHHSKAKGGRPRSKKVRSLAWVVIKWAKACRPRLIMLENVEEFADWGPLDADGRPCPQRKGSTFRSWIRELEKLGYQVEWRELVAADYATPTIRKRLYIVARCDGRPIVWPKPTHAKGGAGGLQPWRSAAECIDWSLPAKSIFDRPKPLALNTQRRIAKGLCRYVLGEAEPFIVGDTHGTTHTPRAMGQPVEGGGLAGRASTCTETLRGDGLRENLARRRLLQGSIPGPHRPVRSGNGAATTAHAAACAPFLTEHANASNLRVFAADEPLRTQIAQVKGRHFALVTAFMEQANGGFYDGDGRAMSEPLSTVCTSGANQRLVTAYFVKYYGNEREGISMREPMHTVTTKDRIGLVETVQVPAGILAPEHRERARLCANLLRRLMPERFPEPADMVLVGDHVLVDITLRMLAPRELARAQGFDDSYELERGLFAAADGTLEWRRITKTDQVRLIGNSVCPLVAKALAAANNADMITLYAEAA